jgi:FKBP-type peptidyl-prolyl cis-trans isomerase (trigger factor)
MGNHVTKDELRAELERQAQRYKDEQGGEIFTYAAQPDPERKPWRKKASLLDQAFEKEIEKIEKDLHAKPDEHGG